MGSTAILSPAVALLVAASLLGLLATRGRKPSRQEDRALALVMGMWEPPVDFTRNPERVPHLPRSFAPSKLGGSARDFTRNLPRSFAPHATESTTPGGARENR
jgi:hypothetical protein